MSATDRFVRFAAECEVMAKHSPSAENKAVWKALARRWVRCAELVAQQDSQSQSRSYFKRHKRPLPSFAH
jgi:hypothetical protein